MKTHRVRQEDELHAAYYAAESTARAAAEAASKYAGLSTARAAERNWQVAELIKMLEEDAQ